MQFYVGVMGPVPDALIMIVNGDAQDLLGPFLGDHIGVQVGIYVPGYQRPFLGGLAGRGGDS